MRARKPPRAALRRLLHHFDLRLITVSEKVLQPQYSCPRAQEFDKRRTRAQIKSDGQIVC
jgi:hypothetical protein